MFVLDSLLLLNKGTLEFQRKSILKVTLILVNQKTA